jgi:hypothetical protein
MKMGTIRIVVAFSASLICNALLAQIVHLPLGSMDRQKEEVPAFRQDKALGDTLELPFFEDFSEPWHKPSADRWLDASVYINSTLPVRPPSIGVATFDGLNYLGEPYGTSTENGAADTLTSYPINLDYPASDSIYLSFFYQPKGLGNFPEFVDSLLLEFKNPDDTVWHWAWGTKGEDYPQILREFRQAMVPVNDTAYLKKGFQFRFRNYAQQNGSWDHWHVDFILLYRGRFRADTNRSDFSFMYMPTSIIQNYESVPLWHFMPQAIANMDTLFSLSLANPSNASGFRTYKYLYLNNDFSEPVRDSLLVAGVGPIQPRQEYVYTDAVKYAFEDPGTEATTYVLRHFLNFIPSDPPDFFPANDTIDYLQIFSNYYALDDGSAEERININNNGGGFVAQRFDLLQSDSLKALQFYFNRSIETGAGSPFFLMIWGAGANQPGELLYSQSVDYPASGGINRYSTFELNEPLFLGAGSYYFGWSQQTNFPLNLGFDRNINNNDRIFYNLTGTWYNYAAEEGTLMIRPLFRHPQDIYVGKKEEPAYLPNWKFYPNPASDFVQIELDHDARAAVIEIYDVSGRLVYTSAFSGKTHLTPIHTLPKGLYFIGLSADGKRIFPTGKLVIHE